MEFLNVVIIKYAVVGLLGTATTCILLQPPDCHPPAGGAADLAQEGGQARGQDQGGAGQQAPAPAPATERLLKVIF